MTHAQASTGGATISLAAVSVDGLGLVRALAGEPARLRVARRQDDTVAPWPGAETKTVRSLARPLHLLAWMLATFEGSLVKMRYDPGRFCVKEVALLCLRCACSCQLRQAGRFDP